MDRGPDDGGGEGRPLPGPPDDWPAEAWQDLGWEPRTRPDESVVDPTGRDRTSGTFGFEDLYDPDELALIEAGPSRRRPDEPVTRVSQWRRRSALGAVLTGLALGLQEVFDPEDERSIVIEVDDDGLPADLPVQVFLDPDSPAGSLCIVHRTGMKPPVV